MDRAYFLIIAFGFFLAMRGAKPAPLQKPVAGAARIWREAADLWLSASLILAAGSVAATAFEKTQPWTAEYAILGLGIGAYLLSQYQKKSDAFFLAATGIVFTLSAGQTDLFHELFGALVVSAGIALFQTCFLGLRHRLLFSRVPVSAKGWTVLCLLAGFISVILRSIGQLVF